MKVVVGLGNPGPRYAATRHNAGFRVALELARRWGIPLDENRYEGRFGRGCLGGARTAGVEPPAAGVLLPQTFMNVSGRSVRAAVDDLRLDPAQDLLVVYDDLDLPFGRLRLRARGGSGGHRGMESIEEALACQDFPRLRFGIGRPAPGQDPVDYVLEPFSDDEERALGAHLRLAVDAVECAFVAGLAKAMERFNRATTRAEQAGEEGDPLS